MSGVVAVRHAGIVVRDLERCLAFYEHLGFRLTIRADEQGPFLDTILGGSDIRVTTAKLAAPSGETLLELLRFHQPDSGETVRRTEYFSSGPTHVALTVDDAEAMYALLQHEGATCMSTPQRSPDGKAKVFFARDPEDNLVELVQILP